MSTRKAVSGAPAGAGVIGKPGVPFPSGDSQAAPAPDARLLRRAAMASFIGNFVEWFDYASYGYLATIIAVVFFRKPTPRRGYSLHTPYSQSRSLCVPLAASSGDTSATRLDGGPHYRCPS